MYISLSLKKEKPNKKINIGAKLFSPTLKNLVLGQRYINIKNNIN